MDTKENLKVVVAAHEPAWVPDGEEFVPVLSGAALCQSDEAVPSNWKRDDVGANISERFSAYGDLCALYWAWKNLDADVLGFACNGRYLASNYRLNRKKRVAHKDFLMHRVATYGIVVPSEINYFVVTTATQFAREHDELLITVTRDVLSEICPEYEEPFVRSLRITHGHHTNLFLMRRDLTDAYCSWLFSVLEEVEGSFASIAPHVLENGALCALAGLLLDPWLDVQNKRYVEISSVRVDDKATVPSSAQYIEEQYRTKYGTKSEK